VNRPARARWREALLALSLLLLPMSASAVDVTPVDIIRNPSLYAGQSITLKGTIANVRPGPRVAGPPATVFDVFEAGAFITVVTPIPPPCQLNSPVTVQGRLDPVGMLGQQRVTNLVQAFFVSCN
jgi:hypothetical protein